MSENDKDVITKETGIEVDKIVFDSNGEILHVDDGILDGIAGGVMDQDTQGHCPIIDYRC